MKTIPTFVCALTVMLVIAGEGNARAQDQTDQTIQQLREFRAELPGSAPSNGVFPPIEQRRRRVYEELLNLGDAALPALIRRLSDPDVQLRRNVSLFLAVTAGGWWDVSRPKLNIQRALEPLITSLGEGDDRVRELAAQAIGEVGLSAAPAVPALIALLSNPSEGSRNSACIGLRGIGPAAKAALPALRDALSDPSMDVRRFARRAIGKIDLP